MTPNRILTFSLETRWRLILFLVAVTVPGLWLIRNVVRIAIADQRGGSSNIPDLSQAVKLDPLNPEFQHRLGLLYEYDWEHSNVDKAFSHLERAATLQPNSANYWVDLGRACFARNDEACSNEAYENAIRLAPAIPHYQWVIANYYLLSNRRKESLSHFRRFLELSPDNPVPTFTLCLRAWNDPELIWQTLRADASDAKLRLAYIDFLDQEGHSEAAYKFWNEIAMGDSKVPFSGVQPYLDRLIANNHIEQASRVWQDLTKRGTIRNLIADDSTGNLMFNGGFEHEPLNSGFDWRHQPQEFVNLDFDDSDCIGGRHCLRIDFTVAGNADYEPVYQIVPVLPKQHYLLMAYARSADISSDSGPRLRVLDPECPTCLNEESQSLVATTAWHKIAINFATGVKTQAVRISVWRPRGRSFPMEIAGHFWLDLVSLKQSSASQPVSRE